MTAWGGIPMGFEVQAASALIASCALIILVTCSLQNVKTWGHVHGWGDLPAGALLGVTSVAQMFHPIEPYSGFIFDLRNVPVALAGALLGFRAALLAACLAVLARFSMGGTGMWTGMLAILGATGMGYLWQTVRARGYLQGRLGYFSLGGFTSCTFVIGLALPEPVRTWFYLNAVPVLFLTYVTILPLLAWIGHRGFLLDTVSQQSSRNALRRRDVRLLSLPAFIHQMRLDALLDNGDSAVAVLSLRIRSLYHLDGRHSRTRSDGLTDAILLRLAGALPEIQCAGHMDDRSLLIPLTQDQLKQLDRIRDRIRECLHGSPFYLSRSCKHWVSYELGLLGAEDFSEGGQLVPRRVANSQRIDIQSAPRPRNATRHGDHGSRFDRFNNADVLFLKARFLMDPAH